MINDVKSSQNQGQGGPGTDTRYSSEATENSMPQFTKKSQNHYSKNMMAYKRANENNFMTAKISKAQGVGVQGSNQIALSARCHKSPNQGRPSIAKKSSSNIPKNENQQLTQSSSIKTTKRPKQVEGNTHSYFIKAMPKSISQKVSPRNHIETNHKANARELMKEKMMLKKEQANEYIKRNEKMMQ